MTLRWIWNIWMNSCLQFETICGVRQEKAADSASTVFQLNEAPSNFECAKLSTCPQPRSTRPVNMAQMRLSRMAVLISTHSAKLDEDSSSNLSSQSGWSAHQLLSTECPGNPSQQGRNGNSTRLSSRELLWLLHSRELRLDLVPDDSYLHSSSVSEV